MGRRRFYVPRNSIREGEAALPPDQAHHLRKVLRLGSGAIVEVFDGVGNGYVGEVEIRDSEVRICGLQPLSRDASVPRLVLVTALIKPAKFEWMLQKSTELGVDEVIPLKTRLGDIRIPDGKIAQRLERWDRIVIEASKQCRRFSAPRIHAPLDFPDFLTAGEFSACTRLLFYEGSSAPWQPDPDMLSRGVVLCIGPEGGWTEGEIEQAKNAGFRIFSLGRWTLRAETAAIAALSIVQHQINLLKK
jgi:16S rRNA (uracil1498-N3)-methyltransferase